MRSEALDITVESSAGIVWVFLSGPFHREQVPNIREKLVGLVEDGNRRLVIELEQVTEMDEAAPPMFLELLNLVRGKGGELRLVFRNQAVTTAFAPYRNIFPIFPSVEALSRRRLSLLWERGRYFSRRTGVRMSVPVALFLVFLIMGWFFSLAMIIYNQSTRIRMQEEEIRELTVWKQQTLMELNELRERLRPMEQLGIAEPPPEKVAGK